MTDSPGSDPTAAGPSDPPAGTPEPEGSGYWERKAAEEARSGQPAVAPYGQPTFNPTSATSVDGTPPAAPPYTAAPPQWGQPVHGQQPYGPGQPTGGYPQPGYPAYGYPAYGYQTAQPTYSKATLGMVLGIVGMAGGVLCAIPLLVSPFAWVISHRALREIRASRGQLAGESQASAGQILGVLGTALLVVGVVVVVAFLVLVVAFPGGGSSPTFGTST